MRRDDGPPTSGPPGGIEGGGSVRTLEPEAGTHPQDRSNPLRVVRRPDGQLLARRGEGASTLVSLRRCFPWSEPARFVSLRDDDGEEFALIEDPAALDATSRGAVESALVEEGFVLQVERILEVEEEIEIRSWRVDTRQGPRSFQTRLDDWPREVPGGGFLIRDVAGDLYHVPDPESLDARSRDLLWAYVD